VVSEQYSTGQLVNWPPLMSGPSEMDIYIYTHNVCHGRATLLLLLLSTLLFASIRKYGNLILLKLRCDSTSTQHIYEKYSLRNSICHTNLDYPLDSQCKVYAHTLHPHTHTHTHTALTILAEGLFCFLLYLTL